MSSHPIVIAICCVVAFTLAASSDWLETRYNRAVIAWEKDGDPAARERAARSSSAMGLVGIIALASVVEVGWWVLLPEIAGLYVGTKLALR